MSGPGGGVMSRQDVSATSSQDGALELKDLRRTYAR
jgi:hypothetical protein